MVFTVHLPQRIEIFSSVVKGWGPIL